MHLKPQQFPWLNSKAAKRVFGALPDGSTRFVGGCVRNALLGEAVSDFDLATKVQPNEVIAYMKKADIAVHKTGLEHGTLTLVADGEVFEITTLRRDVSTDGRRATVQFTTDWHEDANRRDFTINALYVDQDGHITDPTGQGLEDIATRRIRFVGEARTRIEEDYLRILRFFRFNAWYGAKVGQGVMDKEGLSACRELKSGLRTLSVERIWSEVKKILSASAPHRVINTMLVGGIWDVIAPEASNADGLRLLGNLEIHKHLSPDPLLRLMAMSARDEMTMARLCRRWKMSKVEKSRLIKWVTDRTELAPSMDKKHLKATLYQVGRQTIMDRCALRAAGATDPILQAGWWRLYEFALEWDIPDFPLRGQDLINAGFTPGPEIGKTMKALEALWLLSGLEVGAEQLLIAAQLISKTP